MCLSLGYSIFLSTGSPVLPAPPVGSQDANCDEDGGGGLVSYLGSMPSLSSARWQSFHHLCALRPSTQYAVVPPPGHVCDPTVCQGKGHTQV